MSSIRELIQKIENPANIRDALAASGPHTLRLVFEMDGTVQEIIKNKAEAERLILRRIQQRGRRELDDISMACFCYILEKIGSVKAVPELGNLLPEFREIKNRGEMAFSQYFTIHTIKALAKQPGLRANLDYPDDEIEKTIRRMKLPARMKRIYRRK